MNSICWVCFLLNFLLFFHVYQTHTTKEIDADEHVTRTLNTRNGRTVSTGGGARAVATGVGRMKASCGYPGSPRYGRVLHLLERYEEGMVATYECDNGYFLLGPMTRTCLSNGTWSNRMPICDQSMKNLGLSSASEALNNYPPQLAIDGNFRTCFFSNRRKPRWWRVEIPTHQKNQSIISVALTLPPINAELFFSIYVIEMENGDDILPTSRNNDSMEIPAEELFPDESIEISDVSNVVGSSSLPNANAKYQKCATFRGVFSSKTIFVQCTTNGANGLRGNYLQIEDDYPQLEYFGLCEVDLFVARERYECGQVEVPANGYVTDNQITIDGVRSVEYHCHPGHRLIGDPKRRCDSKTGQWVAEEPYCERITCDEPTAIANGFHRVYGDYYDVPIVGTRTVYECRPGYVFVGGEKLSLNDTTRVCNEQGQWIGDLPECEPIDCGHPESLLINSEEFFLSGAQFRLVNDSTQFTSMAELICSANDHRANLTRSSIWFRCREDGLWIEVSINQESMNETTGVSSGGNSCVKQRHNGFMYFYAFGSKNFFRKNFYNFHRGEHAALNILHLLAAVVIAAFLSILIIVFLMFKRKIIEWPPAKTVSRCGSNSDSGNQSQQDDQCDFAQRETSASLPTITFAKRFKNTGRCIGEFFLWIFVIVKSYIQQVIIDRLCFRSECQNNSQVTPETNTEEQTKPEPKSKTPDVPFTIRPSSPASADVEPGPVLPEIIITKPLNKANQPVNENTNKIASPSQTMTNNSKKDDLNTALATFYEEITNAAKQMFSEETDRKLIRAARIAAELDAIKHSQQQLHQQHQIAMASSDYHYYQSQPQQEVPTSPSRSLSLSSANHQWIYGTPPRHQYNTTPTGTSVSLPPSLHEYHQIVALPNGTSTLHPIQQHQQSVYAKVDLIRKHRYRKEKEPTQPTMSTTSVYQVPRPRCPEIECLLDNQIQPQNPAINHFATMQRTSKMMMATANQATTKTTANLSASNYHQLRKTMSTPDTVFVLGTNDEIIGDYGSICRRMIPVASTTTNAPPIVNEPINKYPMKTLL